MYDHSQNSVSVAETPEDLSNEALEQTLLVLGEEYVHRLIDPDDAAQRGRVIALTESIEKVIGNEFVADMMIALLVNLKAGIISIREYVDFQDANGTDDFVKA